jgi:hypothetical protein
MDKKSEAFVLILGRERGFHGGFAVTTVVPARDYQTDALEEVLKMRSSSSECRYQKHGHNFVIKRAEDTGHDDFYEYEDHNGYILLLSKNLGGLTAYANFRNRMMQI